MWHRGGLAGRGARAARASAGRLKLLLPALIGLIPLHVEAQSHMYSWKDANGVLSFSNSAPPIGANATETTVGGEFRPVPLENDTVRNQKLVRVELKGVRDTAQVDMIVDTGAQTTMIDGELAAKLGVRFMRAQLLGGVTGIGTGAIVELPGLRIGSAELENVQIAVGPARGLRLLGMDVLSQLDLTVGRDTLYRGAR
jgi:hypothetical protein